MEWTFEGQKYSLGNDITSDISESAAFDYDVYIIVFYRGELYKWYHTKPTTRITVQLFNYFHKYRNPLWANPKKVFQVLKIV